MLALASLRLVSALLALTSAGTALARPSRRATCSETKTRREWRELTSTEQLAYLDAVLCMQSADNQTSTYQVQSRYDDFVALHIEMTPDVHWTGKFLPFHRNLIHLWEQDLATTCGYEGTLPYWDWTIDAVTTNETEFLTSAIWNATYGFGGNGADDGRTNSQSGADSGGGCVTSGPFTQANYNATFAQGGSTYDPHCLQRDISAEYITSACSSEKVGKLLNATTFDDFEYMIEGDIGADMSVTSVHGGGHLGTGGDMSNTYTSPSDPIFWLHHANIDRVWNSWQRADWETRQSEIGGGDVMGAYPFTFADENTTYSNVTLDTVLQYDQIGDDITIGDVMDIETDLCYTYSTAA
ncbi:hypothetical protein GGR56DRAFT_684258 [Xylariaceae sp. FL0804]|nr:hypothetical protein GGR56DRAFT_684258 [Xylariaceae sp. FL0804]